MGHDVIGLDLGSSEVRAVVLRMALRGVELVRVVREPVTLDEQGRTSQESVLEAAGRLMARIPLSGGENVHCAIPGELAAVRTLSLPSAASRKLEQVLRFELDELLPFDIEDAVFDFVELSRTSEGISLITATALRDKVAELINGIEQSAVVPREVGVATFAYMAIQKQFRVSNPDEVLAIVDIGHQRTNIAVLEEEAPTVRTVIRGGRDLTVKLAEIGKGDFPQAEKYKREVGLEGRVGEALKQTLRPIIREIQQTIKGHLAAGGQQITRLLLCGGGGLIHGLDHYLEDELGVKVERYEPPIDKQKTGLGSEATTLSLAYSLSMREGVPRSKRLDLRQGELAFKGDYEFIKARLKWIAACALAILFSWIFASYAEYRVLADEAEVTKAELTERTKRLFTRPILDYALIKEKLVGKEVQKPPMPTKDAFDIVVELSKRIPRNVVHDVDLLEIKPKRVTLRGVVDAELKNSGGQDAGVSGGSMGDGDSEDPATDLSPTDLVKQKLEEFSECFSSIRVGKVTVVGERRRYQMDIDSKCP